MRRARVGGFRRRAPADAAAGDPFWDGAEPADVVCVVCQEDVTPRDSAAGNVRWLDCGHFGHRECFDGGERGPHEPGLCFEGDHTTEVQRRETRMRFAPLPRRG